MFTRKLTYDALGNRLGQEESDGESVRSIQWNRRVMGRVLQEGDTEYVYNSLGQLQEMHRPCGTHTYAYDTAGLKSRWSGPDFAFHYSYDRKNRLKSVEDNGGQAAHFERNIHGDVVAETLFNGLRLEYVYDPIGRRTDTVLPDGSSIHYEYGPLHLKRVERREAVLQKLERFPSASTSLGS